MPAVMSWSATRFAIKHVLAAVSVIAGMVVCAALSFVVAVAITAASNGDTPALPSKVLFALLAGVASVVLVLAPVTIVAEALCQRANRRIWWQIPVSILLLCGVGIGVAFVNVASMGASLAASLTPALIVTAALLIPLGAYWWALQSADWLLRSGGQLASVLWPSRFAALSNRPELLVGGRPLKVLAHVRIQDQVGFSIGRDAVLVIVGEPLDGVVREGMRVFISRGTSRLSATIASVERIDDAATPRIRLMLSPDEQELDLWKSAASEGQVLQIA